jgi:hypothetical protein
LLLVDGCILHLLALGVRAGDRYGHHFAVCGHQEAAVRFVPMKPGGK